MEKSLCDEVLELCEAVDPNLVKGLKKLLGYRAEEYFTVGLEDSNDKSDDIFSITLTQKDLISNVLDDIEAMDAEELLDTGEEGKVLKDASKKNIVAVLKKIIPAKTYKINSKYKLTKA